MTLLQWCVPTGHIFFVEKYEKYQSEYCNNPKYWDRQAWANSVDPDQMPQNVASDQGLQCLPLIQHNFLDTSTRSKINVLKF